MSQLDDDYGDAVEEAVRAFAQALLPGANSVHAVALYKAIDKAAVAHAAARDATLPEGFVFRTDLEAAAEDIFAVIRGVFQDFSPEFRDYIELGISKVCEVHLQRQGLRVH